MKLRNLIPTLLVASTPLVSLTSCNRNQVEVVNVIVAKTRGEKNLAMQIQQAVKYSTSYDCTIAESSTGSIGTIVLDEEDEVIKSLKQQLGTDESEIYVDKSVESRVNNIYIAATSGIAKSYAIEYLITKYLTPRGIVLPISFENQTFTVDPTKYVTEIFENIDTTDKSGEDPTKIGKYRDPFIYQENGEYYMLATATFCKSTHVGDDWWHLWKATGDVLDPNTEWKDKGYVIDSSYSSEIKGDRWAPELYKYKNPDTGETNYYIFTTYGTVAPTSNEEDRGRGCAVFRSNKLLNADGTAAKFELISYYGDDPSKKGRITNHEQSCIDGHLYIENGIPYMVFVEEFTDFNPKVGRMFVAKMSNDLTHFIEPAKEIFKATDAPWVSQEAIAEGQFRVTDGPFIVKLTSGKLFMLWSSYYDAASKQYCMGYATADTIMGPWTHGSRLIYEESMLENYETELPVFSMQGGHGMIFKRASDNKYYMCIHCGSWDTHEHAFIFPIKEAYGTLVWDFGIK